MTGAPVKPGGYVLIRLTFANADPVTVNVPVVLDDGPLRLDHAEAGAVRVAIGLVVCVAVCVTVRIVDAMTSTLVLLRHGESTGTPRTSSPAGSTYP